METQAKNKEPQHIPVIIGNYSPFRLVFRETDAWQPTLEQINRKDYDYVKLCRLSCFLDIGIAPFSLAFGFDGSLILPASIEFRTREAALTKFNETLGILLLGGIYSEAVQPTDISFGTLFFKGYLRQRHGGTGYESSFHSSIQTKHVGTQDVIRLLNPKVISTSEIDKAYTRGKVYFSKLEKLSPSLLLNGTSNYVKHQWGESLVFLWTSVEQVVNIIWTSEIIKPDSENDSVIEGRSNFLKDFRTWTTSTKIELLYQKGFIKVEQYRQLNKARKSRNDFVHNGKELSRDNVKCALDGLFKLISLAISSYQNPDLLNDTLEEIYKNQRQELIPERSSINISEASHWLSIPPLPGDASWGDKAYDVIEDLVLQPLK